jgi:glycosyltransferase involved in cell wall biosynthesis
MKIFRNLLGLPGAIESPILKRGLTIRDRAQVHKSAGHRGPVKMISVIIPVYNAGNYLASSLESLTEQDYPAEKYEVIVIDNNSTDASLEIAGRFSRVRLLKESKQGAYAARNAGIAAASGDIIAFTDPDCVCGRRWLFSIDEALSKPSTGIVLGSRQPAHAGWLLRLLTSYENCKSEYVFASGRRALYFGYTNNMAVRREMLERHGPFVERGRGADTIFVRRVVDAEGHGVVTHRPDMIVRHLELNGILTYYRKTFTYGRSWSLYRHIIPSASLSFPERMKVFAGAARRNGGSLDAVLLLGALGVGLLFWMAGRLSAAWPTHKQTGPWRREAAPGGQ